MAQGRNHLHPKASKARIGHILDGVLMSHLTQALEQLDRAINKLEKAIDSRVQRMEHQQRDLFSQLDTERDRTKTVARELDGIISHLEKALQNNTTMVQ